MYSLMFLFMFPDCFVLRCVFLFAQSIRVTLTEGLVENGGAERQARKSSILLL